MSTANNNSSQEAAPCLEDSCSFHGSSSYAGYCSVCYKKKMSDKAALGATTSAAPQIPAASAEERVVEPEISKKRSLEVAVPKEEKIVSEEIKSSAEKADAIMTTEDKEEEPIQERPVQKKRNRCWECRKKIGLTGIECRCGYVFCSMHRYADQHSCDFDHGALARKHLAAENQGAQAKKLEAI